MRHLEAIFMIDKSTFNGGTVEYHTLGCKLNFAETSTIGQILSDRGFSRAQSGDVPDIVVVNTPCRSPLQRVLEPDDWFGDDLRDEELRPASVHPQFRGVRRNGRQRHVEVPQRIFAKRSMIVCDPETQEDKSDN